MIEENQKLAALEALLFIYGESLNFEKIEKVLGLKDGEGKELTAQLGEQLIKDERGLSLVYDGDKVQIATKAAFGGILAKFAKEELSEELTPASLETLSLVAYLGPIARSRLEYFRGVNSVFTLRNLMLRGLIERFPDPKRLSSYLYKSSLELVKYLGLKDIQELPDYQKMKSILSGFENRLEVEIKKDEG